MGKEGKQLYRFGPFRVDPGQRLLFRDNQPVPLQPKAFETLLALVENSERLVLKTDLMKTVWPDTFVEESNLTQNIFVLRKALGEAAGERRYIVTVPGRGYRFAEMVRTIPEDEDEEIVVESHSRSQLVIEEESEPAKENTRFKRRRVILPATAAALALAVAAGSLWYFHRAPKLTGKDTIVLSGFTNTTGDPVFDGTLRQGLAAQLEQSPFLNLLSDQRIQQTLSLMAQPKDARPTDDLARQVCLRTASAAVLDGAIAQVGARYLLTLRAIDCSNGESLASTEAQASDKNHVLDALGKMAAAIRNQLGESLASVGKYEAPPEDFTTPSLEALQAYSLGFQALAKNDTSNAIALLQRAISLDPNFAMAYARLGTAYFNLDETERGAEAIRKAYELRERASERERFYITSHYEDMVTRDLEAARKIYEMWARIYPREAIPRNNLAVTYNFLGEQPKALIYSQEALKLAASGLSYWNLINAYLYLNRLNEAKATAQKAQAHNFDDPVIHIHLYQIDFLQHDVRGMERESARLMGERGWEDLILHNQSDTAAYGGHFTQARDLTQRAVGSAQHADKQQAAATYEAEAAVREALVGNAAPAKRQAEAALALSDGREVEAISAIALGLAGDFPQATRLADGLAKRYPQDTVVQGNFLPVIRASAALRRGAAGNAIQALAPAEPYDLGLTALQVDFTLYPVYLRGSAYLALNQGAAAAAEFQKILDHRGLVQNELIGALARLELARAGALAGDTAKARSAYQDFLALWKDADLEIPILKEARREYEKLQ